MIGRPARRSAVDPAFPFGNRHIGPGHPVLIIAEIGVNHEGSAEVCARMIEAAVKAGADAIKLQTVDPDEAYAPDTESYATFSASRLSPDETAAMFNLARRQGLEAFTVAGDLRTLDWIDRLDPAGHKISSGLLTHIPLIRHAAHTGRPLLMSTGMAEVADIDAAVAAAREQAASGLGLMQCTSLYPAPAKTLNLAAIGWLERRYGVPAGLSDHSLGTDAAVLSVAAGARMIEKHFTLDPSRPGYDHHLSLDPDGFAEMVRRVRVAETMMGEAKKCLSAAERKNAGQYRRCLVVRRDLPADAVLTEADIGFMRVLPKAATDALAPSAYYSVLGRRTRRALAQFEPLCAVDLA